MVERKSTINLGSKIIAEALSGKKSILDIAKKCGTNWGTVKNHLVAAEKAGILKRIKCVGNRLYFTSINEPEIPDFLVHHGTCCYCGERNTLVAHYNYNSLNGHCYCEECLEDALTTIKWKKRHINERIKKEQVES